MATEMELDRKWEEVDHELADTLAGAMLSPSISQAPEGEGDPIGLGDAYKCVRKLMECVVMFD